MSDISGTLGTNLTYARKHEFGGENHNRNQSREHNTAQVNDDAELVRYLSVYRIDITCAASEDAGFSSATGRGNKHSSMRTVTSELYQAIGVWKPKLTQPAFDECFATHGPDRT